MNIKAATLLTLFFSTLIVFSCSSLGRQEEPVEKEADTKMTTDISDPVLPSDWKYETEITHKGSRSEGSISRLFYRYNEIPGVCKRIIIARNIFVYKPMVNIWDNFGYLSEGYAELPQTAEKELISSAELKRGWYETAGELIKKATPPEWIFVEAGGLSLWVSPDKLCEMISFYRFAPINGALIMENSNE